MRRGSPVQPEIALSAEGGGSSARSNRRLAGAGLPEVPTSLVPLIGRCADGGEGFSLTRSELAGLVGVCERTISRWEQQLGFSPERVNARVLRYGLATLVGLLAVGAELERNKATELGLKPDQLLALAAQIRPNRGSNTDTAAEPTMLVASDEDERRLIAAWRDQEHGPVLRRLLRGLLEMPPVNHSIP